MKAVIVDGARTPFLRAGTVQTNAVRMASFPIQHLLSHYDGLVNSVDYVIGANIGNQILCPDGSNLARVIALNNGLPLSAGAWTINSNCSSSLHALIDASKLIELGMARCVLVIGVEVMSDYTAVYSRNQRAVYEKLLAASRGRGSMISKTARQLSLLAKIRTMPHKPLWMLEVGLSDPFAKLKMNQVAEKLAREFEIGRAEQDLFAFESQRRATLAQKTGRLATEIVPFEGLVDDNGVRPDQLMYKLSKLKALEKDGTVTPGNSSQITDGACALVVASEDFAKANGWPVAAHFSPLESALVGCDPSMMGLGPVYAIYRLLEQGFSLSDFDVVETNEAFAAVVLAQNRLMSSDIYAKKFGFPRRLGEFDWARTNVNGGAIAIGHPLAASGARLVLTCLREMELKNRSLGLVTLCIGGGQGEALVLHR